jgi:tRNA threonylcarbamoyl adenosine modification protein YeaZ
MRVLTIECATEACSVALFENAECIAHFHEVIGRGHAESLVPAIKELPNKGQADRILVSLGPGSFTGVRIGLAAARALGLAWNAVVLGYPTLALMAGQAPSGPVTVCVNGGHGEWFLQNFDAQKYPEDDVRSLAPGVAVTACRHDAVIGNRAKELAALLDRKVHAIEGLPDARNGLLVPTGLLSTRLTPNYGRAPDARLPATAP